MIQIKALFDITYGVYLVCAGDNTHGNGYISNSVFQVSSSPALFAASCNKNNFTAEIIQNKGSFSVSVLSQDTDNDFFAIFGYQTGRDFNKLKGMDVQYGAAGTPIILNHSIAFLECKLVQKVDVGTHWVFIGELVRAQQFNPTAVPMTYAYYREVKKALAPANSPTFIPTPEEPAPMHNKPVSSADLTDSYKCSVCGYVYNEGAEGDKFSDLPDDWACPVCGTEKEEFVKY
jgi:flavin reductase (DIM6/NTAB) family NADH-FMN oxidoreductase RutF/rubredoxin